MISIIGLGYIGLPTALMLAKNGCQVVGTDCNRERIDTLANGILTFEEKGLEEVFEVAIINGIQFSINYHPTDFYIIAVPTPYLKSNKKIDSQFLIAAIESVLTVCDEDAIIIIESTVSPGTIDRYIRPLVEKVYTNSKKKVHLAHAPERIIPGNMIFELENNSRTIGVDNEEIGIKIKNVYSKFCKSKIVLTDIRTAEMSKVVENTFRDVNIALANELAKLCSADNLNIYEIIRIANMHPRVNILQPGPGVGGHCISVDPWFLVGDYPELTKLILSAREVNDSMPDHVISRIHTIMKENGIVDMSRVGLYGIAYKENVDDIRESPTLQLLEKIGSQYSSEIPIFDPHVIPKKFENQVVDFDEFIDKIDILVIMTAHDHLAKNLGSINHKIILDTKNMIVSHDVYKL